MSKIYKALMVLDNTHLNVVVEAKKDRLTIDAFINKLLKERNEKNNNSINIS